MIKEDIKNKLDELGYPVYLQYPETFATLPAISFYEASGRPNNYADDTIYTIEYDYYIDVWGNVPEEIEILAINAIDKMAEIGFRWTFSADDYGDKIKRKILRFKTMKG